MTGEKLELPQGGGMGGQGGVGWGEVFLSSTMGSGAVRVKLPFRSITSEPSAPCWATPRRGFGGRSDGGVVPVAGR